MYIKIYIIDISYHVHIFIILFNYKIEVSSLKDRFLYNIVLLLRNVMITKILVSTFSKKMPLVRYLRAKANLSSSFPKVNAQFFFIAAFVFDENQLSKIGYYIINFESSQKYYFDQLRKKQYIVISRILIIIPC